MLAIIIIIFPFQGSILRLYKRCIFICLKDFSASAGDTRDMGLISGLERSPGGGNDNLLQYSCLENPTDRRVLGASVHGIAESARAEHTCSHSWLPKIRRPASQERDWRRQTRVLAVRKEGRDWIQCMF